MHHGEHLGDPAGQAQCRDVMHGELLAQGHHLGGDLGGQPERVAEDGALCREHLATGQHIGLRAGPCPDHHVRVRDATQEHAIGRALLAVSQPKDTPLKRSERDIRFVPGDEGRCWPTGRLSGLNKLTRSP